jgi:DNA primase
MYEFMIKQVMDQCDLNTVEGRTLALRAAAPVVSKIRDRVIRDGYARELAGWLGMNPDEVLREIRSGATNSPPAIPRSAPVPEGDKPYTMESLSKDPVTTLERDVLMVLLQHPDVVPHERATAVLSTQFSHAALALVRDAMLSVFDQYGDPAWVTKVTQETPEALQALVGQLSVAPLPESKAQTERYCLGVTATLLDRDLLRQKAELMSALQRTNGDVDPVGYREVQEKLVTIESQRRALRDE